MERKNYLIKNIFCLFFALCFLGAGFFVLNKQQNNFVAQAEVTSTDSPVDKNITYDYFRKTEYKNETAVENSLIGKDTFMYYNDGTSNSLKLSLATNGSGTTENDIYNYVYYPNEEDKSVFYFYHVGLVNVAINGEEILNSENQTSKVFDASTGKSFPSFSSLELETFEMVFDDQGTASNAISIMNSDGSVREGVYTVSISLILVSCVDGKTDMSEAPTSFTDEEVKLSYSFYVLDQSKYFKNNKPNITYSGFDHDVTMSSVNGTTAFKLYSNYSSEDNKIPYIEYDYTRFEASIKKELDDETETRTLEFDKDLAAVAESGNNIIKTQYIDDKCRVYFTDVGEYTVTLNAIKIVASKSGLLKYDLNAVSTRTQNILTYIYGYQAKYTDFDSSLDANGAHLEGELKNLKFSEENGTQIEGIYENSADVTGSFLKSNSAYSQNTADRPSVGNTTFVPKNVINYLNKNDSDEKTVLSAVKTNQTPIEFTTNLSSLNTQASYIFTTNANLQTDANYAESTFKLGNQKLYYKQFEGRTEGSTGTYIYILAYNYGNFYDTESSPAANRIYYQVFFFEIFKELTSVEIFTGDEGNKNYVSTDTFVNEDVTILSTTPADSYNKDVTVQIYALDYNLAKPDYSTDFGGEYGISLEKYGNSKLEKNAKYTIRLFYSSDIKDGLVSTHINEGGYFRETVFTIDKDDVQDLQVRNFVENASQSNFKFVSNVEHFSTNQNVAISWEDKNSGAQVYAYYKWFELSSATYYSNDATKRSTLIEKMITNGYMPINSILNLDTTKSTWIKYEGNTKNQTYLESDYILSDEGFYILDVYDEAGNHKYDVFMLDYTSPVFALYEYNEQTQTSAYDLISSSKYVTSDATLRWGNYKSIYVSNFNSEIYTNPIYGEDNIPDLTGNELYRTKAGTYAEGIYLSIYNKLFKNDYMQYINIQDTPISAADGINSLISSYSNMYITVPIDDTHYFTDKQNPLFTKKTSTDHKTEIEADEEMTYTILIRDLSNTVYDQNYLDDRYAAVHYTNYYSAKQTINVSFDSSEFSISYTNSKGEVENLTSNIEQIGEARDEEGTLLGATKTVYLSPTKMNKAFTLSFIPTITKDINIQVESVTMKYYTYEPKYDSITKRHYYGLSTSATELPIYSYEDTKQPSENKMSILLQTDKNNVTAAGKYEITRTYKTSTGYSFNPNDYYSRTYVFYVDRNEVVSNPTQVEDDAGGIKTTHLESLVGGDIFVSMFDNGQNASLVVTFPNSEEGNTDDTTIYNNTTNADEENIILTTNKLPVYVYVPTLKYTKYVTKVNDDGAEDGNYHFEVLSYDEMNQHYTKTTTDQNGNVLSTEIMPISDYVLTAEIEKIVRDESGNIKSASVVAKSSSNIVASSNGKITVNESLTTNGFLNLYDTNGNKVDYLSEAGQYRVKIIQGRYGTGTGDNNFEQSLYFQFEIQKTNPDFSVRTTQESITSEASSVSGISEIYYTNQSNLNLIWDAAKDKYMAEVDIDKITFKVKGKAEILTAADVWDDSGWPQKQSDNTYLAGLDLKQLGIYEHGTQIDITMQYKNQDTAQVLYQPVTKRLIIDLSAPSTNVENLVSNAISTNMQGIITRNSLRVYLKASGKDTTTDLNNTSYNISNSTDKYFAYYSYTVGKGYVKTLVDSLDYKTYIRKFYENGKNTKYNSDYLQTQETDPLANLSNFDEVTSDTVLDSDCYYEIVETDKAGNRSIYTIFVTDYDSYQDLISYSYTEFEDQTLKTAAYTSEDFAAVENHATAKHNIYSQTGFEINNINFFGDEWAQIKLETVDARGIKDTKYLMMTPWKKGYVLAFGVGEPIEIAISDLIDGSYSSENKNCMTFYNRENKSNSDIYINIRNRTMEDLYELTDQQNSEFIRFNKHPSSAELESTTTAQHFLTYIKITANNSNTPLYEYENKLGYAELWPSVEESVLVSHDESAKQLKFEIAPSLNFATNTRIEYVFKDNYGKEYSDMHFFKETIISTEFSAYGNHLYSYDDNGKLVYITKDGFQYSYNAAKFTVQPYNYVGGKKVAEGELKATMTSGDSGGITTATFRTNDADGIYNDSFVLEVRDREYPERLYKEIYFTLYNELPTANLDPTNRPNVEGEFKFQDAKGNNITSEIVSNVTDADGYFSEVRILFKNKESTFLPIKYSISTDKLNWRELTSGERLTCQSSNMETYYVKVWYDEQALENEFGTTAYVFGNVPESQIYKFNLSSLTATYWIEKTVNGVTSVVEKSSSIYVANDSNGNSGRQYTTHYIVNLAYEDRDLVEIKLNKEQELEAVFQERFDNNTENVKSDLWLITNRDSTTATRFETYIVISYIPTDPDEGIVDEFFTYDLNGNIDTYENLVNVTNTSEDPYYVVIPELYTTYDKIELQWSKYYGIAQNEISIKIVKDGITLSPTVYTRTSGGKEYNYTYLTYSGKYSISLYDVAGNVQKFNRGTSGQTDIFTLIFLKDVPFTLTYTDIVTGEEVTTLPIKQATYNSAVTLNIDPKTISQFYSGRPTLIVKRNGEEYKKEFADNATTFMFDETGYYEVTFTAQSSQHDVDAIRWETYQFTILNPNEYKISYVYNKYSNYYVEKIVKDGVDITAELLKTLDIATITVDKNEYLTQLPLSYLDEKTGTGEYLITINSNNQLFKGSSLITSWTYKVKIKSGSAPIKISHPQGQETTDVIEIDFNLQNIYDEFGECTFRLVKQTDDGQLVVVTNSSLPINSESVGDHPVSISNDTGTFYVQFVSPSGILLFSYKVVRTPPMNAASIIAIVISVIVLFVVIFIIVKLRKRISVK